MNIGLDGVLKDPLPLLVAWDP